MTLCVYEFLTSLHVNHLLCLILQSVACIVHCPLWHLHNTWDRVNYLYIFIERYNYKLDIDKYDQILESFKEVMFPDTHQIRPPIDLPREWLAWMSLSRLI